MAITYPLSVPSVGGYAHVTWHKVSAVSGSESPFTFDQQVYVFPGQRWEVDATLGLMERADAEEWIAFLIKLNGREGTFLFGDPAGASPRGTAGGTPLVNGASQTGNSLITDGWTGGATFKAGDWFQLGTGANSELYKNLSDVTADGPGNATLDIWPKLRTSPADNAALTVNSAKGVFRLASNDDAWDIDTALHFGLGFVAVEDL